MTQTIGQIRVEIDRIQQTLCSILKKEMQSFKQRKGIAEGEVDQEGTIQKATISERDKIRFKRIHTLNKDIQFIAETLQKGLDESNIWNWRHTCYRHMAARIDCVLDSRRQSISKYSGLDKLIIQLMNLLTALIFPVALIKKATTGSFFFSTVGKTKEALMDARNELETLLPTAKAEIQEEERMTDEHLGRECN